MLGAGFDVKALLIHIAPEVRFTRWGARHFIDPAGCLTANRIRRNFWLALRFSIQRRDAENAEEAQRRHKIRCSLFSLRLSLWPLRLCVEVILSAARAAGCVFRRVAESQRPDAILYLP